MGKHTHSHTRAPARAHTLLLVKQTNEAGVPVKVIAMTIPASSSR